MSKQNGLLIVFGISILSLIMCTSSKSGAPDEIQTATVNYDSAYLVDVRTVGEFAEGSVANAVNIPLDEVENQIEKFKNKKKIVVFCRSGKRSSQAKSILDEMGIANVIDGGGISDVQTTISNSKK